MKTQLTRKFAGFYTTDICGEPFAITYFNAKQDDGSFTGWIIASARDWSNYSDPIPTLRDCRAAIEDMTIRRGVHNAWAGLIAIANFQGKLLQRLSDSVTNAIPLNTHKLGLVFAAARALVERGTKLEDKYAVWDVIDEFGRSRVLEGVLITNPFYDQLSETDYKAADELYTAVLAVAKTLTKQPA